MGRKRGDICNTFKNKDKSNQKKKERKVKRTPRIKPGNGTRNRFYCTDRRSGYLAAFCPTSIHSLHLVRGPTFLWRNIYFPTVIPRGSGVLTTPLVQQVGQAEDEVKVEAGDVNRLHEPSSSSDLYHCRKDSLFPWT